MLQGEGNVSPVEVLIFVVREALVEALVWSIP
jgi:hypothetical protein